MSRKNKFAANTYYWANPKESFRTFSPFLIHVHLRSKLATTRLWHTSTLAEELEVADADEDEFYNAMDWLLGRQKRIEKKLAARHLSEGDLVFYDVSSSYYEGRKYPLAFFRHERDGKKGKPIIV